MAELFQGFAKTWCKGRNEMKKETHFLIVGLGLMGGSYAMALSKSGYTVMAIDANPISIKWALENGIISNGADISQPEKCGDLLQQADCIVLAIYPKDMISWVETNQKYFKKDAIITDLAGVKSCFLPQIQSLLTQNEFIGCHPMAGREVSGVQNATATMFKGANFIITPTDKNSPAGIAFAHSLAQALGCGNIIELSPEEHDIMIGYVSQLTHAIAVSLINANNDPRLPQVTGDSFRDLTRIANMNDELWSELFLSNQTALIGEIDTFIDSLTDIRQKLVEEDKDGLKKLFQQSTQRRKQFDK